MGEKMAKSKPQQSRNQAAKGFGIGPRLYIAFGAMTALTVIATATAWVAFTNTDRTLRDVTEKALPAVTGSLRLAVDASGIAAIAPALISADSEAARQQVRAQMKPRLATIDERITALSAANQGDEADRMTALADDLRRQLGALETAVDRREGARDTLNISVERLLALHQDFLSRMLPLVDAASEKMAQASDETVNEAIDSIDNLVSVQVTTLQAGLEAAAYGQRIISMIGQSAMISSPEDLEVMQKQFTEIAVLMSKAIKALPNTPQGKTLAAAARTLLQQGVGENSEFAIRRDELDKSKTFQQVMEVGERRKAFDEGMLRIAAEFDASVGPLVKIAQINLIGGASDMSGNLEDRISQLIEEDVAALRVMLETLAEANMATGLLSAAASSPTTERLAEHEAAFEKSAAALMKHTNHVAMIDGASALVEPMKALAALGQGEDSIFAYRRAYLSDERQAQAALSDAQQVTDSLETAVGGIVKAGLSRVERDTVLTAKAIDQSLMVLLVIAIVSVVVGLLIGWLVVQRQVVRRLVGLAANMRRLADGNMDITVDTRGRDEIAGMAATVEVFRNNSREVETLRANQLESEKQASEERQAQRIQLADAFESRVKGIVDRLGDASRKMAATAEKMADGTSNVRDRVAAGVSVAHQTSASVQTVASAAEQLSASIVEISGKVNDSSTRAREAAEQAENTNRMVENLEDATARIDTVVTLIQDIAEQTNLLALNATIEAARAGEAGKGFAVVASEVKNLATQTGKATDEITQQIKEVQDGVTAAATAIRQVSEGIREIDGNVTAIAGAVEEQGSSTQEIARSSQDAASGTNEVTETIEQVSSVAEDTGQQAEAVLQAATTLANDTTALDKEVLGFLEQVRSGGRS